MGQKLEIGSNWWCQNFMISGDKVKMEVDVATNMGIKTSIQDFLILENNDESLVMGMQWHTSLVGEQCGDSVRMVNIDTFWTNLSNPWNRLKIELRRMVYWMMPPSKCTQNQR